MTTQASYRPCAIEGLLTGSGTVQDLLRETLRVRKASDDCSAPPRERTERRGYRVLLQRAGDARRQARRRCRAPRRLLTALFEQLQRREALVSAWPDVRDGGGRPAGDGITSCVPSFLGLDISEINRAWTRLARFPAAADRALPY